MNLHIYSKCMYLCKYLRFAHFSILGGVYLIHLINVTMNIWIVGIQKQPTYHRAIYENKRSCVLVVDDGGDSS